MLRVTSSTWNVRSFVHRRVDSASTFGNVWYIEKSGIVYIGFSTGEANSKIVVTPVNVNLAGTCTYELGNYGHPSVSGSEVYGLTDAFGSTCYVPGVYPTNGTSTTPATCGSAYIPVYVDNGRLSPCSLSPVLAYSISSQVNLVTASPYKNLANGTVVILTNTNASPITITRDSGGASASISSGANRVFVKISSNSWSYGHA